MTHGELLLKWQHTINSDIPTWTEPLTLCWLAEQASRAQFAVESGTYMGASAFTMLAASPELHLWCVDKFDLLVFGTEKITRLFLRHPIYQGRCELIVGDSERAASMLPHMRGKLDLVFIDDGHATPDVIRDIESFRPLVRSGGILCGHDWEGQNDVAQGVKACIPESEIQIPVPRLWCYLKP